MGSWFRHKKIIHAIIVDIERTQSHSCSCLGTNRRAGKSKSVTAIKHANINSGMIRSELLGVGSIHSLVVS